MCSSLESHLRQVNHDWERTIALAKQQNEKLNAAFGKSRKVQELMTEISSFLDHLEHELPTDKPVGQVGKIN